MRNRLPVVLLGLTLALFGCSSTEEPASNQAESADVRDEPRAKKDKKKPPAKAKDKQKAQKPTSQKPQPKKVRRYAVLDVIDGDTVEIGYQGGVSVRIIGIDTPETVHPSVPDECWGGVASAAAANLLSGKKVALKFDPSQGRTDYYGRTLGYLQLPGIGDFGLAMIKRGHAAEYTYDTAYARQGQYQAADSAARSADRGLWGKCGGPDKPLRQPEPKTNPAPAPAGNCEPGYDPCVPPYPPDVNCDDVDGPISVSGSDPHGLDADGDGVACES